MAIFVILKQFNFFLNNTSDSDMTMSDGSRFQVVIVWFEKKLALIKLPDDMGLLGCCVCHMIEIT